MGESSMGDHELIRISRGLSRAVGRLSFAAPVTHVYNPLDYAASSHEAYLDRFGRGHKRVIFLGMNPGPFGMAQTGVPFGDVTTVGEWLEIGVPVGTPVTPHPKRPILGLACPRVEVSGRRLWGWVQERWDTPEAFFVDHFVANYCPLVFLEASGRNRTPDRLPVNEREPLFDACNIALKRMVAVMKPEWVVGIGAFAARRAADILSGNPVQIGKVLHPSPASPAANRGWREAAETQLREQGILES
jgi:single-strand selective monofunctional uracil DNA glycosylase